MLEETTRENFRGFCVALTSQQRDEDGALYGECTFCLLSKDGAPYCAECFLFDAPSYAMAVKSYVEALPLELQGYRVKSKKKAKTSIAVESLQWYEPNK